MEDENFIKRTLITDVRTGRASHLLAAPRRTLKIQFTPEVQKDLRTNGYRLCFSKKVRNFDYHLVWRSVSDFLSHNTFSWDSPSTLFVANTFKSMINIEALTVSNAVSLCVGQQTTIDRTGIVNGVTSGKYPDGITLINQYGKIYPGLTQVNYGIDLTEQRAPFFISDRAVLDNSVTLIPEDKILVWLDSELRTGDIFDQIDVASIEVDLSGRTEAQLEYNGNWKFV